MSDYTEKPKRSLTAELNLDEFSLDPDYSKFKPGVTELKFKTVYDDDIGIIWGSVMFLGCLPVLFLMVSLVFYMVAQMLEFQVKGIETQAIIRECDFIPAPGRSNDVVDVAYEYTVDNQVYVQSDRVINNYIDCENLPLGSSIQIQYLKDAPEQSNVTDVNVLRSPWEDACMNGVIVFMLIFVFVFTFRNGLSIYRFFKSKLWFPRLQKSHILLDGEVVKVYGREYGKSGGYYHVHVLYRFKSPTGKILERWQKKHREDLKDKPLPQSGTPVTILYADDDCHVML